MAAFSENSVLGGDETARAGRRMLATALAAGIGVVLVIFFGFAVYNDRASHQLRRAELADSLTAIGEATAWGAENWLTHRTELAREIAATIADDARGAPIDTVLDDDIYQSTFIWTYYGETDGAYHIAPPDDLLPADYDPRTRPWYYAALAAGETTLTEPYFDIATGVETITVASPVYRDGSLLGVVGADFSTASLGAILKKTNFHGKGKAFLVTGEGRIIADPNRENVSKSLAEVFADDAPEIDGGVQYLDDLDAPQIVAFLPLDGLGSVDWYLGLTVDRAAAFRDLSQFRISALIASVVAALALVLVLGYVIHRLLVQPLMAARRAADAANVAKSEFLASMSHEIRTPMNGVIGMAEVLSNTNLDARQRELANIIVSSGHALMTVINDILDFTKLETDKMRLAPRGFNLRQSVFEIATLMQARAVEKDIELIVRYAPDLPEGALADDVRLRQVLSNLIGNAVKFTEHGYVLVDVSGEVSGHMVRLKFMIKDTGIGIEPDQIDRMFERFEQADASHTRRFGGTGLGLAICKKIVDLMGGEIGATSAPGKGSEFWFTLALPIDDTIEAMGQDDLPGFEGAHILAVDDNAINRRVLAELIQEWGMRITLAAGHRQAMTALEKSDHDNDPFTAILMDYQMPEMSGVALTEEIQEDPRFRDIPVIVLSSIDDAAGERGRSRAKLFDYLSKPVRPSQLMDSLVAAMSQNSPRLLREMLRPIYAERAAAAPEAAPRAQAGPDARIPVLVAEDNIVNQMVIRNFLDDAVYAVHMAEDGEKAVALYQETAPAIVFMDLSMPVMNGYDATRAIRELEKAAGAPHRPIIATTAHVLDDDRRRCAEAGMDDFVSKPIRQDAVKAVLAKWLGAGAVRAEAAAR